MSFDTGYEPLGTLKPVEPGIWVIDGPATVYRKVPVPTRATVIKLSDGSLWIHAPTGLNDALIGELRKLGPVGHLIAPRVVPCEEIETWQKAFPQSQLWRTNSNADPSESFKPLGEKSHRVWKDDFRQVLVEGKSGFVEPVFYHIASRSLIVADFLHRIDTANLPARFRPFVWFAGTEYPTGRMPPGVLQHYHRRDHALADAVEEIASWQPRRIILSHGVSIEQNVAETVRYAFRKQIRDRNMGRLIRAQRGQ